jgi:hypothetical protein
VAPDAGSGDRITREQPKHAPRPPLSGRISTAHNPGLKPWAVLYSRFAAKVRHATYRPKKQSRRSPSSDYGGKLYQQHSLSTIGYRLLLKVAALLHGALDLVLARLQRLFDGLFTS